MEEKKLKIIEMIFNIRDIFMIIGQKELVEGTKIKKFPQIKWKVWKLKFFKKLFFLNSFNY